MIFRIGIFAVLIIALVSVMVFAYSILNQPKHVVQAPPAPAAVSKPAPAPVENERILTAAGALHGGDLLKPTDIGSTSIPANAQVPGEIEDTPLNRSLLVGSMLRVSLNPGTPIMDNEVIHPGDHGFLAAVLKPGMRAVTVSVDTISGADGLIWPGDYVDLLLTQNAGDKDLSAAVVLSDVQVIATGDTLVKNASGGAGGGSVGTVTLEVTPEQASRVVVAAGVGHLYLILHSAQGTPNDDKKQPVPPPVYANDLTQAPFSLSTVTVTSSDGSKKEFNF